MPRRYGTRERYTPNRSCQMVTADRLSGRRTTPLSYTHRAYRWIGVASGGSWATFYFPQNSFVWGNKKMDSRPHNRAADVRVFCGTGPGGFAHPPEAALHPRCTRTALSTALGSGAATITRPNLPCSGRPAHPPSCPKTSRQRLTTATYPAPHALHHLPCTSCLLSVVFRQRRSTCGRVVREFGMGRARERGRVGDGLRARWGW